jgi:hypothetical protein
VFVWIDAAPDATQDTAQGTYRDASQDALLAAKDETIAALREQLAQSGERDRENRRIIAALTSRIPAIEAPTEAPGSPERDQGEGDVPTTDTEEGVYRAPLRWQMLRVLLALSLLLMVAGSTVLVISTSGEPLAGIGASVMNAFATAISSGLSEVTGDQAAIIVSSIITVIGTISTTYLGIRWQRRGRNQ